MKVYEILYGYQEFDQFAFDEALKLCANELPNPAVTETRPGVGFILSHQGRGWHYVVLCWWDNENELPTKIFVRKIANSERWKPAAVGQAICVWDLEVIWFERNAYINTVMAGEGVDEYLSRHFMQPQK